MKNYIMTRCALGIIGSIIAIIGGIVFLVEGIKYAESKGYLIGGGLIAAGAVGILICVAMIKSASKK